MSEKLVEYEVENHRLLADGKAVRWNPSPNIGGAMNVRRFLVMHFTAGPFPGCVDWMCDPDAKVSAHLVITRGGEVIQLVAFNRVAWHAGKSKWQGYDGLNKCSIGIELENWGELLVTSGQAYAGPNGRQHIPQDEWVRAAHKNEPGRVRAWHEYTDAQTKTAAAVAEALVARYNLDDVVGHDDISPGRKVDPGPAWPMGDFREVLGFPREVGKGKT